MIMPQNHNKNLEQKSYTECVTHENYYSLPSPLTPILYNLALKTLPPPPPPPPPTHTHTHTHTQKNQIWIFCKIHLLENSK